MDSRAVVRYLELIGTKTTNLGPNSTANQTPGCPTIAHRWLRAAPQGWMMSRTALKNLA
jgi:hypothetical protein